MIVNKHIERKVAEYSSFAIIFFWLNTRLGDVSVGIELINVLTIGIFAFCLIFSTNFKSIKITSHHLIVIVFLLYIHLNLVYKGLQQIYSYGVLVILLRYLLISYFMTIIKDHRKILKYILVAMLVMISIGFLEALAGRTFFASDWQGADRFNENGSLTIGSTVASPNYLALNLIATFPLLIYLRYTSQKNKNYYNFIIVVYLIFTYVVYSRTGMMLMVISLILLNFPKLLRARYASTFFYIFAVLIVYFVYSSVTEARGFTTILNLAPEDKSLSYRSMVVIILLQTFLSNPILGIGKGQFKELSLDLITNFNGKAITNIETSPMNTYLGTLAELGIVGGILLFFYLRFFYMKALKENEENISLLHRYLLVSTITVILYFFVIDAAYVSIVLIIFAIIGTYSRKIKSRI